MKKMTNLYKVVEDKTITWFENTNQYLVLENTTADIIKRLNKGISVKEIAKSLSKKLSLPEEKAIDFILSLDKKILKPKTKKPLDITNDYRDIKKPKIYNEEKYYQINDYVFKVSFLSEIELSYIHPKFAHLETAEISNFDSAFEVFIDHNYIFLYVDGEFINSWSYNDVHFFQGKFSMLIIQKIHNKEEKEWLGIFHASAVSNSKKSILFLGDSGNGKSTSLSLLQANGFTCLADDFVPVDAENQEVYSFPAAISIKKNSLKTLLPIYPELETSAEYHFERLNKIVRFLPPNNKDYSLHLPCNELVFIKYEKNSELIFKEISKIDAFEQLVPDSWLSPLKENAQIFLNWFGTLNCYQLQYSKNEEMLHTVKKLFDNDF